MKFYLMILCACALSAGCQNGYEEIRKGRTADVYLCGTWGPEQIEQVDDAILDINSKITLKTGAKPLRLAGEIPDAAAYDESAIGDGQHCVYLVYENYPTAYGRSLWDEYKVKQHKGGLFDENDDIVLFSSSPDGSCHIPGTPEGWPCTWQMQDIVAHEFGHAFGREHAPPGSGENGASRPESMTWTDKDVADACTVRECL